MVEFFFLNHKTPGKEGIYSSKNYRLSVHKTFTVGRILRKTLAPSRASLLKHPRLFSFALSLLLSESFEGDDLGNEDAVRNDIVVLVAHFDIPNLLVLLLMIECRDRA